MKKLYARLALLSPLFLLGFVLIAQAAATGIIRPNSDGAYTAWTPSTGSTHYTLVDETTCNGNTDRNSTNTVGNRDSYGVSLSSIANGSQITQIAIVPCASRNSTGGGGSSTMNVFYRLNGADSADAGAYALTGTTPVKLATTSFSGLAVNKGSATTLQIGAVYSSGTKGARLSNIATMITYTALNAPSGLVATATSSSQIDMTWVDNSTIEENFALERGVIVGTSTVFSFLATTSANTTSYSDTGLSSSTVYKYRLRTYNSGGFSVYSNTATATTTP